MSDLREEVILEEGIVDLIRRRASRRPEADSLKTNEFWNGHEFLQPRKSAWGKMQFLHENSLIHDAVPVDARLHVTLPFVEVDLMALRASGSGMEGGQACTYMRVTYLVNIDRQQVAAR